MPQITGFQIKRDTDKAAFDAMSNVCSEIGCQVAYSTCHLMGGDRNFDSKEADQNRAIKDILQERTIGLRTISFTLNTDYTIQINRSCKPNSFELEGNTEALQITKENIRQTDPVVTIKLIAACRKHFGASDSQDYLDYVKDEDKTYYQARETSLQKLERMQADFFERLQSFTTKQAEEYQQHHEALTQQFNAKSAQLDADHQNRLAALQERERQFDEKRKEFDDRASTLVRRQLGGDLQKKLEERIKNFQLTKGTSRRRWPVLLVFLGLLAAFGWSVIYFLWQDLQSQIAGQSYVVNLWVIGRQILFASTFAITAAFFIKWLNQWAQRHADEELKIMQLGMDFARAMWVVEMAREWKEEKDTEVPEYIVERMSRDLFIEDGRKASGPTTAIEALADLLTSAASATVKVGDSEVNFTKKSLQEAKKKKE